MEESLKPGLSKEEAAEIIKKMKAAKVPTNIIGPMVMSFSRAGIDKWLAEWEKFRDAPVDESKIKVGYSEDYDSTLPPGAINARIIERVDTSGVSEAVRQSILDEYLCATVDGLDYRLPENRITCPKARAERERERERELMRLRMMEAETKLTKADFMS